MSEELLEKQIEEIFHRHKMPIPISGEASIVWKEKILNLLYVMEEKLYPGFMKEKLYKDEI